jgi:hypothetical protein
MNRKGINHRGGVGCEENFPGWDYTEEECEFLMAMDRYKREARRPYPTWREVLRVLKELGYRKVTATPARASADVHREDDC